VPEHVIPDLRAALARSDVKHTIKVFPATQHGFAFPERAVYETVAAEQTWADMFAMWDRRLR
jgi:carboxymethylenebutenolidase